MPEGDNMYEYPEQLLAGADRPRPLPPDLRARLEEALEAAGTGTTARPLSAEVRDKLETSLRLDVPEGPEGPEGPGGPGEPEKPEKKWRAWAPRLSVAAAVIIALAIFVPTLSHPPGSHPPGSHGPGPGASHTAAGPLTSRSGLSAINAGAAGRASRAPAAPAPAAMRAAEGAPPTTRAPAPTTAPATSTAPESAGSAAHLGPDKSALNPPPAAFVAPAPVVDSVSPQTGPVRGGAWVMVHGTNLLGARAVYFGRVPATRIDVLSVTELKAVAPAHAAGTVDVVVSGPSGRSQVSAADRYTFTP